MIGFQKMGKLKAGLDAEKNTCIFQNNVLSYLKFTETETKTCLLTVYSL